jgi:hypothetical protein
VPPASGLEGSRLPEIAANSMFEHRRRSLWPELSDEARGAMRRFRAAAAVMTISMLVALLSTASARAISAPIHIHGTGTDGVLIRPTPDTSQPGRGWMAEGTSPDYHCFTYGQMIGNVNVWFYVTSPAGITGYYASYWDDSSYRSEAELTAKYGIPKCGAPAPPPATPPSDPAPSGGLVFTIFNADGGIYYRRSPSWGDTAQTPGVGVYNGDRVELICGAYGEAVGPYANTWWSYVRNLTRPSIGDGWVNAHFIDDGAPANQPAAGEPTCGPDVPGSGGGGQSPAPGGNPGSGGGGGGRSLRDGGSLFYSPYNDRKIRYGGGWKTVDFSATKVHWQRDWNGCRPNPGNFGGVVGDTRITTVAAWSKPRNLPFALLNANPGWISQVNYILLFDPGNEDEYNGSRCPSTPTAAARLVTWLAQRSSNTLVILAGDVTAQDRHAGIQRGLFNKVRDYVRRHPREQIQKQVVVCNYSSMSHEDVWVNFHDKMNDPPIRTGKCPRNARSWSP